MRARPDADIIAITPVVEIVPALGAAAGMVRDFIGGKTRGLAQFLRRLVKLCGSIVAGNRQLPLPRQRGIRRARLDGELVERQMFGAE